VLAGAGSGKTRTLTYRVAHLLSQGVKPHEILLLTFTNKAAREMLHRVQDLTGRRGPPLLGRHLPPHRPQAPAHLTASDRLSRAFTILDADEADSLLREAVEEKDKGFFKDKTHPRPGPLFEIISFARNTQRRSARRSPASIRSTRPSPISLAPSPRPIASASASRASSITTISSNTGSNCSGPRPTWPPTSSSASAMSLVDEYQDTNTLQAQIVDIVGAHHRVMAVGDDAQCIYSWRGANFENIITFPDRHPGTQIYRIETNYRSTPSILAFANGVLAAQPKGRHFEKELRPARPDHEKPFLVQALDTREQASFVVQRIKGLVDEGRSLADIAVLYRAHFQALDLQLELSRLGMPYVITSGVRFFEQAHIRDLVAMLRFVYNPSDAMAWQRIAVLLPRVGDKGAQKLHERPLAHARAQQRNLVDALAATRCWPRCPRSPRRNGPGSWPRCSRSPARCGPRSRSRPSRSPSTAGTATTSRAPTPTTPRGWTT
jgi:DNA helicase-2/ATP-dependent DNA helicase PcrA